MSWNTTFYYEQDLRSLYMNGLLNSSFRPGIYNGDIGIYTRAGGDDAGIYATIKKGTTLIFSDGYVAVNGKYERDPDSVGSYLIKCVAGEDETVQLASLNGTGGDAATTLIGNGSSVNANRKIFITAVMNYKPDEATQQHAPLFYLVIKNENASSGDGYFTEVSGSITIPDGMTTLPTTGVVSYLFMGMLGLNKDTSYGTSGRWDAGKSDLWIQDHFFTSRGLPDYRQNLIDMGSSTPDLVMSPNCSSLYIDAGSFYEGTNVYDISTSWLDAYTIRSSTFPTPTSANGYQFVDLEENYSKTTTQQLSEVSSDLKVLMDVVFLATTNKVSGSTADFKQLFNGTTFNVAPAVKHIRIASNTAATSDDWNPGRSTSEFAGTSTPSLGIDCGKYNLSRLTNLIKGKNIIPAIIDTLRVNGFFEADAGTSLIPVALIFRGYDSTNSKYVDGVSSATTVHAGNILSFADIQFKSSKFESFKLEDPNVFSILPILG